MKNTIGLLREPSVAEQLEQSGFTVTEVGEGRFNVVANATGAIAKASATEAELRTYLTGIRYVQEQHNKGILSLYNHTKPVFPVV